MKSNLPDPNDDEILDSDEVDKDIMHDNVVESLPDHLRRGHGRRGIDVAVDPRSCTVTLRRTRRAKKSFTVTVDFAVLSDCGDATCLGCRTKVAAHVIERVLGGIK